jgi:hypothetical protein
MVAATRAIALIRGPRQQQDRRAQRRADDRRLRTDEIGIGAQHHDRDEARTPRTASCQAQPRQHERPENGDVAAGDGDDVIRAGLAQPALGHVVKPTAVANEDRRRDATRPRAPPPDVPCQRAPHPRPRRGRPLRRPDAGLDHVDEQRTLDRPAQRLPEAGRPALLIGNPRVQVARRPADGHRHPDPAARTPGPEASAHAVAADGDAQSTRGRREVIAPPDPLDR